MYSFKTYLKNILFDIIVSISFNSMLTFYIEQKITRNFIYKNIKQLGKPKKISLLIFTCISFVCS